MSKLILDAQVFVVTIYTGFPHGMAASRRILLICKALKSAKIDVAVIHINTSEKSDQNMINHDTQGIYQDVPFIYCSGSVLRGRNFLCRRWLSIKGMIKTLSLMIRAARKGKLEAIMFHERSSAYFFPIFLLAKFLSLRCYADLVEWPAAFKHSNSLRTKIDRTLYVHFSLRLVNGITTISEFLKDKAIHVQRSFQRVMLLPILADVAETSIRKDSSTCSLILSISSGYKKEISLVLSAINIAIELCPNLVVYITGGITSEEIQILARNVMHPGDVDRIITHIKCTGYVSRPKLLSFYSISTAALIPLNKDERSVSRFPFKIAEYCSHSIPIIVGDVGEASTHFIHKRSALFYVSGSAKSLAEMIISVYLDPIGAKNIGMNGRNVAIELFHYKNHSSRLAKFLGFTVQSCELYR